MSAEVSPNTAPGLAKLSGPSLYEEKTFNNSLKSAGADASARERESEKRLEEEFDQFVKRYPFKAWMSITEAKREFAKLNARDREKAIRYAAVYAASIRDEKRKSIKNAADWLRDRDFDGITMVAQSVAEQAGLKAPKIFVIEGTPWWDAWQKWRRDRGMQPTPTTRGPEGKTGWYFDSQLPPKGDTTDPPAPPKEPDDNIEF